MQRSFIEESFPYTVIAAFDVEGRSIRKFSIAFDLKIAVATASAAYAKGVLDGNAPGEKTWRIGAKIIKGICLR
jgi:hypothetical protein